MGIHPQEKGGYDLAIMAPDRAWSKIGYIRISQNCNFEFWVMIKPWDILGDYQKHCRRRIDEAFLDDVLISREDGLISFPMWWCQKSHGQRTYLNSGAVCHCRSNTVNSSPDMLKIVIVSGNILGLPCPSVYPCASHLARALRKLCAVLESGCSKSLPQRRELACFAFLVANILFGVLGARKMN